MREPAHRRGPDNAVHAVTLRTLGREYRLWAKHPATAEAFAFLDSVPEMPGRELEVINLEVEGAGPTFRMKLPDGSVGRGSREALINEFMRALGHFVEGETLASPILHAATASWRGVRGVFLGNRAFGKTTLMLRLLSEGFAVEGDELVVVGAEEAIVMPRRLHVKAGALPFVRQLAAAIRSSPSIRSEDDSPIYAVTPSIGGLPWRIEAGAIDHLYFIEPNHGGQSTVAPLKGDDAFGRLVCEAVMPTRRKGEAAARLRATALNSRCWSFGLGELDDAVHQLRRTFAKANVAASLPEGRA